MPYVFSEKTGAPTGNDREELNPAIRELSDAIAKVAAKHKYEAAFAGLLNYCLTRLIQELPRGLMIVGAVKEELRYWLQPLFYGVLLDVALEHKRRVNVSYEAAQIAKSGDCYDAPYYTKLIEIVDKYGEHLGYQEIMIKRENDKWRDSIPTVVMDASVIGPSKGERG